MVALTVSFAFVRKSSGGGGPVGPEGLGVFDMDDSFIRSVYDSIKDIFVTALIRVHTREFNAKSDVGRAGGHMDGGKSVTVCETSEIQMCRRTSREGVHQLSSIATFLARHSGGVSYAFH